jgi:hypothetical protein
MTMRSYEDVRVMGDGVTGETRVSSCRFPYHPITPSPYDEYDISLTSMKASRRGVQTRFSASP